MEYRIERDTMGDIKVSKDKLWAAQTQRSLENFKIGNEKMPKEVIKAFAIVKKASANINCQMGKLEADVALEISKVCDEIQKGKLDEHFPLVVWQTGSGTQTNMNVNEVIANYINQNNQVRQVHPNDDINKSQSSNDTFPTAMHISAVKALNEKLYPALELLTTTLKSLSEKYANIIKIGRTHLQDATPLTLGQEISAWVSMLQNTKLMIKDSEHYLYELALGGTAVGTGLNAPKGFDDKVANEIQKETGFAFISAPNKFHALTSKDAIVHTHGALKALATNLMKIANDTRWLASGPRCGIGEISIPENEPGSSIMPGKVNPTQAEALTMVVCKVMGNDASIGFAASQGNFQLNVFMPVIITDFLQSVNLLAEAMTSFNNNCAVGISANIGNIQANLDNSLMLVTALNHHIGYENAARVAKYAYQNEITLKEAALKLELVTSQDFDKFVDATKMV
ncbi:MAG: fumarate hydratase, class II [Epulopiscium sp. Nuni2H_MBin001]|nr:MAG: fumarate hydratase, class II [Epulopiscium sp. Nuni2H_MBin001]